MTISYPPCFICVMKKQNFLLLLLFPCIMLHSQDYQLTWQQCFGGSMLDGAYDIIAIENGYFIVGGTGSNDGDITFSYGNGDGWLIKTDSNGNLIWEKTYGGSDSEGFSRIIPASDNTFYLLGLSFSSDGDISYDPYPDSPDYWIVKIDSSGNIIWDKILGGNMGEVLFTGDATIDGGVVAIGQTSSNDGDISVSYGGNDTWIVKLSNQGELEWDYTIGTDWFDTGQAILATSDGGYLIGSNSIILEGGIGNITCTPHTYGWVEGVLFKLDSNLNVQWQRCYGGSNHDGFFGIIEIEDGYVLTGSTSSNDGDVSGWHGESDAWIVNMDFEGNIIWQNPLGGSRTESGSNILKTNDGALISVVSTYSNDGNVSGNHSMSEYDADIWLAKLNSEGELLSQQCFGGAGNEIVEFGIVKKSDNNFVIAGQTDYGPSYDVGCTPHGGNWDVDYWVFEIKDTLTSIQIKPPITGVVKVYPNPTKEYVSFQYAGQEFNNKARVEIFNSYGEKLENLVFYESVEQKIWDCRNTRPGIYFYIFTTNGYVKTGKIIIY